MRWLFVLLVAGCAAPPTEERAKIVAIYDAASFNACAACHMDTGAGIPAAYPPVRNRAATMASLDGGREYLITTVSFGIMGAIEAEGQIYNGVMPGNAGSMQPKSIAATLNYLVFTLNDESGSVQGVMPFSATEVLATQAGTTNKSLMAAGLLRGALLARHGSKWPK